jgi:N utilization substance protein A
VLALSREELVRRTDLEEDTVEDILNILRQEFE